MSTSPATPAALSSGAPPPLRVAVAGCHRMTTPQPGSHNWAAAFAAVAETRVVAVFDRSAETREAFRATWTQWGPIEAFDDPAAMLRAVRPDVVCIATRQTMHAEGVRLATEAGARGILCDKPLATTLGEVEAITGACREARVPLAFGLDRRWMVRYGAARRRIAEGAIGDVTAVIAYGLPNVINHGCHWYDAALALAGDPEIEWVSGAVDDVSAEPPDSRRRLDPAGRGEVGLANGATVYVTTAGAPGPSFEVLGARGRLLLLDDARAPYLWTSGGAGAGLTPQDPALTQDEPGWPAGPAAVRDLVRAVREGGRTACDAPEAFRASAVGFAIHASHRRGGARITLAEVDRDLRVESLPWGNE